MFKITENLFDKIVKKWNCYKYRFVPWIAANVNDKHWVNFSNDQVSSPQHLVKTLVELLTKLEDYAQLKDNLELYARLHFSNQQALLQTCGFSLCHKHSSLQNAGNGIFIREGQVKKGSLVGIYAGTVYQPYQPILLQSVRNQFLFRCSDGVLLDGNDRSISRIIYKSCCSRDQVGLIKTGDTSWLTPWPVNPLNVGQYVNNGSSKLANVCYQEVDINLKQFPLSLRKFIPNVNYASVAQDGYRDLRLVVLVALRDISAGEELLSSYFTLVQT